MNPLRRFATAALVASILAGLAVSNARATPIEWVTVGDPGNASNNAHNSSGYGTVNETFKIMKFEFTNQQYTDFLNSVAQSDPHGLYNTNMYTEPGNHRGGITRSGDSGSYVYTVNPSDMGNKPVNWVSWFDAARVANWLTNGATSSSSTETGAYTLDGATSGNAVAVNPGATYFIPTEAQWYKAAYYKGGGTNAGYWTYATQSDSQPGQVTADGQGNGSAGSTGNYANYSNHADWNSQNGNVTSVGTNGGPSAYGAFDMSGNIYELMSNMAGASNPGIRGGAWDTGSGDLSVSGAASISTSAENNDTGFRLATVPEPSTCVMALAGIACGGFSLWRRRKQG